jgi:non-heme chloroperoxidase
MAYLKRDCGRQVYYESHGSGDRAVLLIHGWGMSCRAWDNVVPVLRSAGHRVVLIDHRGCGASDKDFDDLGIAAIAGDVVDLVVELGLSQVVLNGWSLGGAVAVASAVALGERCRALVLTGGATPIYVQQPDLPLGGTRKDLDATVQALVDNRIAFLADLSRAVCAMEVGDAIEQWLWQLCCEASPRAFETLAELGDVDQREALAALDLPLLGFVGSEDAFVDPAIGRWVGEHCPRGRVIEYQGVGHAPFLEVRERYNHDLCDFLRSLD